MKYVKLKDICTIVSGGTPKTSDPDNWDGEYIWITPAEINDDSYIINDSKRHITEKGASKLSSFPKGTVILSSRAPIGKVAIAGTEMYCNQGFKNLICSSRINNEYLYWYLKNKTQFLNSLGRGATFKEISKSIVGNIEVPLPELDVQLKIVEVMKKITDVMATRKRTLDKLDTLIKARFVEIFGDTKLNMKKFPQEKLSKIAKVGSSRRVFARDFQDSGIPFFRGTEVGALAEGKKIIPKLFISKKLYKELVLATGKPKIGDLLMPSICPDGRIWQVNTNEEFYFKDARVLWISPNSSDKVNSTYLRYALKQVLINNYRSVASGSTFAEMKIVSLKGLMIILPPIELQNQFASFVQQVDKSKVAIQKSLDETQLLFDSLMQEYFS